MARQTDGEYASTLMSLLRQDCERLATNAAWASIVMWESEELSRQAGVLRVPVEVARQMRMLADEALGMVRRIRAAASGEAPVEAGSDGAGAARVARASAA